MLRCSTQTDGAGGCVHVQSCAVTAVRRSTPAATTKSPGSCRIAEPMVSTPARSDAPTPPTLGAAFHRRRAGGSSRRRRTTRAISWSRLQREGATVGLFTTAYIGDAVRVAGEVDGDPAAAVQTDPDGIPLLYPAARSGQNDVLRAILAAGADPNGKDRCAVCVSC